jgi:hypothetical protein
VTTVIAGATSDTYVVTAADLGSRITVTASGILTRYNVTSTVSAATVVVAAGTMTVDTAPTISGDATTGSVLTVDPGVWVPDTATFTYVWMRDGVAISPAKTLATYTVVTADEGLELTVVVTGSATGYANLSATTVGVTPVVPTPFDTAPVPEVAGDAIVGETLTVDAGTWDPAPDSLAYVWKRAGVAIIPAATETSYVLTSADAGAVGDLCDDVGDECCDSVGVAGVDGVSGSDGDGHCGCWFVVDGGCWHVDSSSGGVDLRLVE